MVSARPFFKPCETGDAVDAIRGQNERESAGIFFAGNALIFFTRLHDALSKNNGENVPRNRWGFFVVSVVRLIA